MKIGLVYLNTNQGEIFPVGLISIATAIKQKLDGCEVEIIDINFEDPFQKIISSDYDLIGISCMTVEYEKATVLAKKIKEKLNIPIIIGGVHISTLPVSFRDCFDIGVIGEGEETFLDIIKFYKKKGRFDSLILNEIKGVVFKDSGRLVITPKRDLIESLDSIPALDYSFINSSYFRFRALIPWAEFGREAIILTSRGCPYKCIFCSTTQFWNKVRYFSVERIVNEITNLVENHKVDHIQIFDDLFTINKDRLKYFAQEFNKKRLYKKVKLTCQARANLVDDELCLILKSMNVRIVSFGFESGNERVLRYLKCGSVSVEQNKKAIAICVKHRLKVVGSLIFGSPTETLEEMRDTIKLIDYTKKIGADRIWSFVMTPFPATKIWEIAKERGSVSDEMNFDKLNHQTVDEPLLLEKSIDRSDFKKIFCEGRRHLHYYKWKKLFSMLMNNPFNTILLIIISPWQYIKRGLVASQE